MAALLAAAAVPRAADAAGALQEEGTDLGARPRRRWRSPPPSGCATGWT
jgi:hypothetical protein